MEHSQFLKGRAALDAAHYSSAKIIFEEALVDDPLCAYGLYALVKIGAIGSSEECERYKKLFRDRLAEILSLADADDPEASFVVGVCYEKGLIEEHDPNKTIYFYEKSYLAGNLRAGFNLACCLYEQGQVKRAISVYEHLCAKDVAEAYVNLAYLYLTEKEFENIERGFSLLDRAAQKGDVLANFHLGMAYLSHEFRRYDAVKAIEYLEFAAERDHIPAIMRLAQCYETGEGTEKDLAAAAKLYRRALFLSDQQED